MNSAHVALRNEIYRRLVELGRAPTRAEIDDDEGLRPLHDEHALVLDERAPRAQPSDPDGAWLDRAVLATSLGPE
jgi:hypothetical protein